MKKILVSGLFCLAVMAFVSIMIGCGTVDTAVTTTGTPTTTGGGTSTSTTTGTTTTTIVVINYTMVASWGASGTGDAQFQGPSRIGINPTNGQIYTTDNGLGTTRVQVFDTNGTFIRKWGKMGTLEPEFVNPYGVAFNSTGDVFISDDVWVRRFDASGNFVSRFGGSGSGDGQFTLTRGMAISPSGEVYVGDRNNFRIQVFGQTGSFLRKWATNDPWLSAPIWPSDVAVDSSGNVYVTSDWASALGRIYKFNSAGTLLATIEGLTNGLNQGICFDSAGNLYACNNYMWYRVEKFSPTGRYLTAIGSAEFASEPHYLMDVSVDSSGNVYVFDSSGGNQYGPKIYKFAPQP